MAVQSTCGLRCTCSVQQETEDSDDDEDNQEDEAVLLFTSFRRAVAGLSLVAQMLPMSSATSMPVTTGRLLLHKRSLSPLRFCIDFIYEDVAKTTDRRI